MHENHRERMRERFMKHDFDGFATHELFEMLLYYVKPRGDTNETAHLLLNRFGSIHGIFNADIDELMEVDGIGENSAIFLKMIPEITKRYFLEEERFSEPFDKISRVYDYFMRTFIGCEKEYVYLMLLNNRLEMIDCCKISEGSVNASEVNVRKIHELVMKKKASSVILAHNHPHGLAVPSEADYQMTETIQQHLGVMGIVLIEHILVTERNATAIMKDRFGLYRCSPLTGAVGSAYYQDFYDIEEQIYTPKLLFT